MHFSKTYAQLLLDLPPELRENAIEYRQLKKIINKIVGELSSLGLTPSLLHELLEAQGDHENTTALHSIETEGQADIHHLSTSSGFPRVVYEINEESSKILPRLRISLEPSGEDRLLLPIESQRERASDKDTDACITEVDHDESAECADSDRPSANSLLWTLQRNSAIPTMLSPECPSEGRVPTMREVIIPLTSDGQFFDLLYTALETMSSRLKDVQADFLKSLETLSRAIADSARPSSSSKSIFGSTFYPHSPTRDDAGAARVHAGSLSKSDLYTWREIFQLYTEAEVFESIHELDRGERSVEESEHRLRLFVQQVTRRGIAAQGKFKLKGSRTALEAFLQLNVFILNIKKFQLANAEAARKILKKHTKRTALPLPSIDPSGNAPAQLALLPNNIRSFSLPRVLVQAIGETLLPVIPHIDDYCCLICTSIAFKPIRLDCGHLFCVRCLVKMQKRGQADCPMCRTPCVLVATRANVDWALMNFMQDWFPIEAKEKLKNNEKEAAAEEYEELGIDPNARCIVM